jgi:endonuclease YncB( thermonuclease family)
MKRIGCTAAIVCVLLVSLAQGWAAEQNKGWITLDNCRYVDGKDNDGDSFRVSCAKEGEFMVRLYFVDAPEISQADPDLTREQGDYFGVSPDEVVKAGLRARENLRKLLNHPFAVTTHRASAAGGSAKLHYYAMVKVDGKNLAELLVGQGWARTKGVITNLPAGENWKMFNERLQALESEARQKRLGIWTGSAEKTPEARKR